MTEPVAASPLRVRPYTLTMGRTTAAARLEIETIVRSNPAGGAVQGRADEPARNLAVPEASAIIALCHEPMSIAEISAHLKLPLQVVKILVGDLVADGRVVTQSQAAEAGGRPDLVLLERVLEGLQSL